MRSKGADRMENSVDPYQTASTGSARFSLTGLSQIFSIIMVLFSGYSWASVITCTQLRPINNKNLVHVILVHSSIFAISGVDT